MSTNKGCAPGKSSLIGLGSARDYGGCAIPQASLKGGQNFLNYAEASERFLSPFAINLVITLCSSWITCL